MHHSVKLGVLLLLIQLLLSSSGCVGPNKLKRGWDRKLEKDYVKHPLRAEFLLPISFTVNHIAGVTDYLFINPLYWWRDVVRGRGTSYEEATSEKAGDTTSE